MHIANLSRVPCIVNFVVLDKIELYSFVKEKWKNKKKKKLFWDDFTQILSDGLKKGKVFKKREKK